MEQEKKEKIKNTAKDWLWLNVGSLLISIGVYFFKSTNHFATGGVSGIAILLTQIEGVPLQQSEWVLIFNVSLLILGFIFLGRQCTFKTIYCTMAYSLENLMFEKLVPLDAPLTNQPLMELCYSMLLIGAGSALIFNHNGSSGGTDIIALILKKYSKINVGIALLITDFFIAASTFFVADVQAGLFSLLGLFAKSFLVDGVIENIGKSKYITIITTKPEEIANYIIEKLNRSYTTYEATGGYTGEKRHVLITVCSRSQAGRIKAKVKEYDPSAFTIITDANEILGKGFRGSV